MILPILTIAPSVNRGRGVFTTEDIPAGTIIEISPVLPLSAEDRAQAEKTALFDYIFEWGDEMKQACVAWGYVSLYNHSYQANCEYEMDFEEETIRIKTVRGVKKGEELFVNYNAVPDDETPIWFEVS
ncbi:SET domain-containing protein [Sediminibacterium soli]|uniref:SET domain-containing protein n=1 Tax=Sediminibacterium soli TaxID=2698829 RepID=UPI00137A11CB|nr:SET domain-containing protein [Sediminibacterium soli]NCI46986.1 SET domain-containing protein [Sediminibacterium soli]